MTGSPQAADHRSCRGPGGEGRPAGEEDLADRDGESGVPAPHDGAVGLARVRARSAERGAGTVLVVGVVLVGLVLMTATAVLGQAVVARHRAVAAADLAALAAADVLLGRATGDACVRAGRTAQAGGARLVGCAPAGQEVVVRVVVPVGGLLSRLGPASAAARAGPSGPP